MAEELHVFQLSVGEFAYLQQLASRYADIGALLGSRKPKVTVRLTRAEAEQIRDYLTKQLAESGFDENYLPNQEGRILEELVDRFYVT